MSSGRPASASTRCGRCSTSSATGRARSSRRAASGRWATAPGRHRRQGGPTGRDRRLHRRRRLLPDDLAGAARHRSLEGLPIVVVIVNNGWLGMVRQWQEMFYASRFSETHLTHQVPDYAQLAEAYGAAGFTVESEDELESVLERGDLLRAHRRRRRALRPRGEVLPDDPGRRRGDRHDRVLRGGGGRSVTHTLSVLVENKPGALARVSNMFARRGFQHREPRRRADRAPGRLPHHAARSTATSDLARADREADAQARQRPPRLELEAGEAVERELALIRVAVAPERRAELIALADMFKARVADLGPEAMVFEVVGPPEAARVLRGARPPARPQGARPHGPDRARACGRRRSLPSSARSPLREPTKGSSHGSTVYREGNLDLLSGKVAVLGYGSQGHAHALNLRDSGVDVEVGLRDGSSSWAAAEDAGLTVETIAEAVRGAQLVAILLPDHVQKGVYEARSSPNLEPDAAVLFAHGFNVHFGQIEPAPGPRRDHGRAEGARAPRPRSCSRRARARRGSSRSRRMRAATLSTWRSPTAPRSAAGAQA